MSLFIVYVLCQIIQFSKNISAAEKEAHLVDISKREWPIHLGPRVYDSSFQLLYDLNGVKKKTCAV